MWPQNSVVFQCSGQGAGSFLELFLDRRKKLSLSPKVLRRVHWSWGNRALPWQHTPGPASHLRKAPSPVCLCRLPGAGQRWGWGCFSLTCRFASCVLPVFLWSYLLIVSLFPHFSDFMFCKSFLPYHVINVIALEGKLSNSCTKGDTVMLSRRLQVSGVSSCCYSHATLLESNLCKKIVFMNSSYNYVA